MKLNELISAEGMCSGFKVLEEQHNTLTTSVLRLEKHGLQCKPCCSAVCPAARSYGVQRGREAAPHCATAAGGGEDGRDSGAVPGLKGGSAGTEAPQLLKEEEVNSR